MGGDHSGRMDLHGVTIDTSSYLYADASDGSWGVAFAYVQAPDYPTALTFCDPYLIVMGNDYGGATGATSTTIPAGTAYFDNIIMMILPHAGTYSDVQPALDGLVEGVSTSASSPEAW